MNDPGFDVRFTAVRAKIDSDVAFREYSISILSTIVSSPGGSVPTSVAVSLSRSYGNHNSSVTGGVPLVGPDYLLLSDPDLNGSSNSS